MTDKVQKIREEVERLQNELIQEKKNGFGSDADDACVLELQNVLTYIDSLQKKPVSEELKVELEKYIKDHFTIDTEQLDRFGIEEKDYMYSMDKSDMLALVEHFINWHKTKEEPVSDDLEEACEQLAENARKHKAETSSPFFSPTDYKQGVIDGAKWRKEHLWKPADGDDLPEIDREVIALLDNGKVAFAHRPPEYWDGKDIVTGKVTRNYPKTYGKGGWNLPDIKWWLDVELPKEKNYDRMEN